MNRKIIALALGLLNLGAMSGKCSRPDNQHMNSEVRHCYYHQEDIYRNYSNKPGHYKEHERRKQCFFCSCPIEEHTKRKTKKKQPK